MLRNVKKLWLQQRMNATICVQHFRSHARNWLTIVKCVALCMLCYNRAGSHCLTSLDASDARMYGCRWCQSCRHSLPYKFTWLPVMHECGKQVCICMCSYVRDVWTCIARKWKHARVSFSNIWNMQHYVVICQTTDDLYVFVFATQMILCIIIYFLCRLMEAIIALQCTVAFGDYSKHEQQSYIWTVCLQNIDSNTQHFGICPRHCRHQGRWRAYLCWRCADDLQRWNLPEKTDILSFAKMQSLNWL